MLDRIQKGCVLGFSGVFAAIWLWLVAVIAIALNHSKIICLLAAGLLAALLLALWTAKKALRPLWERTGFWWGVFAGLWVLMGGLLLYTGLALRVYPGWDFGAVYQGAVEIAEDGILSEGSNWYFTTYPNNMTLCLFMAVVFKLFGGLCSYITLGVLWNVGMLLLGFFFLFLLIKQLFGIRWACLGQLLCLLFLPFYMHTPIFYSDTLALPFVTGVMLVYQLRKRDARFLLLTAAVLAMGYKVKGSLGVILIAFLIHIWLQREKLMERVKKSLLLAIPFLLLVSFLSALPGWMGVLDASSSYQNEFPVEHWLAMGLTGSGGYSAEIYWMTASVEGKDEKKAVDREYIQEKLEEYGFTGMLSHIRTKAVFTWGDGVYFAPEKIKRDPLKESSLHSWFLYTGANYSKTYQYCNAYQLLLLFGILLSFLRNFLKKGIARETVAMQLAVFGLFLFLLLWETRSRYLVNFVPVFLLLCLDGLQGLQELCRRKKQTY